ncbi:FAD-dependent oxidoreductase [Algivirga pacifica]|uniref:FAD-binding domain-containing protein n=1 Tax=Algivirga pacifica TaxID=1162670 RepID=A0ABP9DBN4_9BACT
MDSISIAGAGPTGLALALFLKQKGVTPYIFEQKSERVKLSKAFGVNPRTLTLLEETGATERFLQNGRKMTALNLWRNGKIVLKNDFSEKKIKYPFMLVQSQEDSERILEELLLEQGVEVDRGKTLQKVSMEQHGIRLQLKEKESLQTDFLFGADGAGSTVRKSLGLSFQGHKVEDAWNLIDLELELPLDRDDAHIFLLDKGAVFIVRVYGDVWRVIGNVENLLEYLPKETQVGQVIWKSDFGISHRSVENFNYQHVFLGGDAAHIHSGLGARGMNLGIEDAYVFAQLFAQGNVEAYNTHRKPVIDEVMKRIEMMTDIMRGQSFKAQMMRKMTPILPFAFALVKDYATDFVLGLDHDIKI